MRDLCIMLLIVFGGISLSYDSSFKVDSNGVAIRGYDPVAYFTQREARRGSEEHQYEWEGAKWYFLNEDHKKLFMQNPEKYAPQYGGHCAYAVAKNYLADGDPERWAVVGGKLYLNFNAEAQSLWAQNTQLYIKTGNRNWPNLQKTIR
jgi:YHS domain-containing protein